MKLFCTRCGDSIDATLGIQTRCSECGGRNFHSEGPVVDPKESEIPLIEWELTEIDKITLIHYGIKLE